MEEVKQIIKAMVISCSDKALTVTQLNQDFKTFEGCNIPHQKLGFRQLEDMLRHMSDTVRVRGYGPTALVSPVISEKTQHVRNMIVKQKKSGKNSNAYKRHATQQSTWNRSMPQYFHNPVAFGRRNDFIVSDSFEDSFSSVEEAYMLELDDKHGKTPPPIQSYQSTESSGKNITKEKNTSCVRNGVQQTEHPPAAPRSAVMRQIKSPTVPLSAMTLTDRLPVRQLPPNVKPKCMLKAMVVSVLSPNSIYAHLMCQIEKLEKIANYMYTTYSVMDYNSTWKVQEEAVKKGLYCAVKYQEAWYRGMIAGSLVEHRVEVDLVDCAIKVSVALHDIWYLKKTAALQRPPIMRVSLAHVKPSDREWKEDATRSLQETMCNKYVHMYVVDVNTEDDIPNVIFIDTSTPKDIIINSELVLKKHAKWTHED